MGTESLDMCMGIRVCLLLGGVFHLLEGVGRFFRGGGIRKLGVGTRGAPPLSLTPIFALQGQKGEPGDIKDVSDGEQGGSPTWDGGVVTVGVSMCLPLTLPFSPPPPSPCRL